MATRAMWVGVLVVLAIGCEGVSHENIDKWQETEKGPGKLEDALVEYVSYLRLNPGDHRVKDHALMLKDRIEAGEGSVGEGSPGG